MTRPAPDPSDASTTLTPPSRLAVIGGGQLGRMFLQAAQRLGFEAGVICERPDDPAAQVASWTIHGASDDTEAMERLVQSAEAVTIEFENVSAAGLRWLDRLRVPTRPGWRTVRIAQNRILEKRFLDRLGLPLPAWAAVRSTEDLERAVRRIGVPLILKTADSGYDGKGQIRVEQSDQVHDAWSSLGRPECVAEAVVRFAAEVSVVVARSQDGQTVTYPVCLNDHRNHILDTTVIPAPIGPILIQEAQRIALEVAQGLETVGVLTVEMFLDDGGTLRVNEIAPRPHNSGHATIEAATTSQFEQQVRALAGLPLGPTRLVSPAAMVNLLGDLWERGEPRWTEALRVEPAAMLHLYGKREPRPGRKMGHLTVLDVDPEQALLRALAARDALRPERTSTR